LANILALYIVVQFYGAIRNFSVLHVVLVQHLYVVVKLISDDKSLEKCASEVNRDLVTLIYFYLFFQIRRYKRSAPSKLYNVYVFATDTQKIFSLTDTQSFIHSHSISYLSGFLAPLRQIFQKVIH